MSIFKKLFGFFVIISIIKMVAFPSEAEMPEDNASLDRMEIKLSRHEFAYISSLNTESGKQDHVRKLKLERIHKIKAEKKRIAKLGKDRLNAYFEARIKGKTATADIVEGVKIDFRKFGERKGGIIGDIAKKFTEMSQKNDTVKEDEEKQETLDEVAQNTTEEISDDELDLDFGKEDKREEISQEVLDSIFGKDDDDDLEEDEEEEEKEKEPEVKSETPSQKENPSSYSGSHQE